MIRFKHIEIAQYTVPWKFFLSVFILAHLFIPNGGLNAEPLKKEQFTRAVTRDIAYGHDMGNVGLRTSKDLFPEGPESFTHDVDGNVYICDTVNRSIKIFSPQGGHLSVISLGQTIEANDVVVDPNGHLYVYDDPHGKLYQFDRSGNLLHTINVDSKLLQSRGSMHLVNDEVYMSTSEQEDVLIGRIDANTLVAPADNGPVPLHKGIHGPSGRRYFTAVQRLKSGEIAVFGKAGELIKSIPFSLPGVVSMSFLREDNRGNFYIQTERLDNRNILLEVHQFDPDGTYASTVLIPDNDYSSWSVKLLSVDDYGNIFQFLPKKDKGQLNIFHHDSSATRSLE